MPLYYGRTRLSILPRVRYIYGECMQGDLYRRGCKEGDREWLSRFLKLPRQCEMLSSRGRSTLLPRLYKAGLWFRFPYRDVKAEELRCRPYVHEVCLTSTNVLVCCGWWRGYPVTCRCQTFLVYVDLLSVGVPLHWGEGLPCLSGPTGCLLCSREFHPRLPFLTSFLSLRRRLPGT